MLLVVINALFGDENSIVLCGSVSKEDTDLPNGYVYKLYKAWTNDWKMLIKQIKSCFVTYNVEQTTYITHTNSITRGGYWTFLNY